MKFKLVFVVLLAYFSLEILVRRFYWGQIPTQVSAVLVYGLLALNAWVIFRMVFKGELKH